MFSGTQVLAQTPNQKTTIAASGSFIDYFAEERQFKGHEGSVNSANFSYDGQRIVTAGSDGTARIWDFSGKELLVLQGHQGTVRSANFSPDGQLIVTASFDGTARVWNNSGQQLAELKGHQGNVNSANFSPDGKRIVTAGADQTVRIWDISGKQLAEFKGHEGSVYSVNFSPDGQRIVTAAADKTARVWDLSGKVLAQLQGHTDTVWSANFSPDGQRIVTASDDKTARVWDLSGKVLAELKGHSDSVYSASFSPDGQKIVTASVDKTALIWDSTGKLVGKLPGHQGGVNSVGFSADGKFIVSAANDGNTKIWNMSTKLLRELPGQRYLSFSSNGQYILTVSDEKILQVWNIDGTVLAEFKSQDNVIYGKFSPDTKLIVTLSETTTQVWDIKGKLISQSKHDNTINKAIFSPDSQCLVTTGDYNQISQIWDMKGKLLAELEHDRTDSTSLIGNSVTFSLDGQYIMIISGNTVAKVWDINGKLISEIKDPESYINRANFSPDNKLIITTAHELDIARIWNINGKLITQLKHDTFVKDAMFSPDGQMILTADEQVRIWDLKGKLVTKIPQPNANAFFHLNSEGKLIIITSTEETTRFWDISGKMLRELVGSYPKFSADRNWTITSGYNTVKVWNTSGQLLTDINGFNSDILDVSISPDARQVAIASDNIGVWYLAAKQSPQIQNPVNPVPLIPNSNSITSHFPTVADNVDFSFDGKKLLTIAEETILEVWDISGNLLAELKKSSYSLRKAHFSPNAKQVLVIFLDNAAIWDISSNNLVELKGHTDAIIDATWSQNGKLIVTTSKDGTTRLWDTTGKQIVVLEKQDGFLYSVSFSQDGQQILTATDKAIRLWHLSGKQIAEIKEGAANAYLSQDGKRIISTLNYGTAKVWDISGKLLFELGEKNTGYVNDVFLSPDGQRIVIASKSRDICVWDNTGKLLARFEKENMINKPYNYSFSQDGQRIAIVLENAVEVWDLSGKLLLNFQAEGGKIDSFAQATLSADGQSIAIAYSEDPARVFDMSGKQLAILQGRSSSVNDANFSQDGKYVVTASSDKIARVWDISGNLLTELKGHLSSINSASFSPDGKLIVTTSANSSARIWDISGKQLSLLKGENDFISNQAIGSSVASASFSPDGKFIFTVDDNLSYVQLWTNTGKLVMSTSDIYQIQNVRFSLDSKRIMVTGSSHIYVWDISGKMIAKIRIPKGQLNTYRLISISPDEQHVILYSWVLRLGFYSTNARLWVASLSNAQPLVELKGHQGYVNEANFSADSQKIIATSNNTARVWDLSGKLLTEFKGHQGNVTSANFSSDGNKIVTSSDDGTARIWDNSGKQLVVLSLSQISSSPKVAADRLRDLEFYAPNCAQAFEPWQKALKIYQEISDRENQAIILEKLGNAYYCLSDYTNAINSYTQASSIAQQQNYPEIQARNLSNIGSVYNSLADYEPAIKSYAEALKLLQQQNTRLKAEILRGRGNVYNSQGKYHEAIQDYSQALAIEEKWRNAAGIAKNKVNLANIYYALGDYSKAIQYYKETLDATPSESLAGLGNTYLSLGDTVKAIELHNQSLAKARQIEDKEAEGNALNNLAYALMKANNLPEAEKNLLGTIKIWESLRAGLNDANKVSIFEKQSRTYRLLQEVLIAQNKINQALEISERGRSRAFVELLSRRLSPNPTQQSSITPPNIEQIKQIAKSQNATLVQYSIVNQEDKQQIKESEIYIWVVKPTGEVAFHRQDIKALLQTENKTLAQLVDMSRLSIGVRSRAGGIIAAAADGANQTKRLQQLHDLLIKPIANQLPSNPSDRIIFIPQGSLFLVPFPALQDAQNKYLVEKHTILTAPSIQLLDFTRQQKQAQPAKSASLANLVVGNPTMPFVSLVPGEKPQQLPPLKGAEEEAKAIAPLLNTKAITGSQATETAIAQKMTQSRIIHLATHGFFDDLRGLGSAIALAPAGKDDGLLTAEEILDLKLQAELVVLSACDTGRGKITGDGVIGLSRSFISAGVPSIVVSLWQVPDTPTASLMTEFYQNLSKNHDKAAALRQAMLTTIKTHPDPVNWAAFTLIGEVN
ncbi:MULTISPECIES: CHAT domain-containing protein [Calothrix]|uniref:CHAT domain-containing protein n=1 Tax=Calothrix TaxID=1186 RepID=UPI001F548916|nr:MULTISPECIES: CHAT domain-containing protein [Calothrix]